MQNRTSTTRSRTNSNRRASTEQTSNNHLSAPFVGVSTTDARGAVVSTTIQHGAPDAMRSTNTPVNAPTHTFPVTSSMTHAQQAITGASNAPDFGAYGYNPGGPMLDVDWGNALDFGTFSHYFEPVGELKEELNNQQAAKQDFTMPQSVPTLDTFNVQSSEPATFVPTITPSPIDPSPSQASRQSITQQGSQAVLKRKASEVNMSVPTLAVDPDTIEPSAKRTAKGKPNSASHTGPDTTPNRTGSSNSEASNSKVPSGNDGPPPKETVMENASKHTIADNSNAGAAAPPKTGATGPAGRVRTIPEMNIAMGATLPAAKVFPIQIGSELFRLSGASISSDAPSYFSSFFGEQLYSAAGKSGNIRTLYIDRDPETFRDISLHLQGYYVRPRDGAHFVKLFADAQFYSLPRLTKQLFKSDIFIQIGERHFQIPRDIFSSPGDSPNYFTLGFAHFFTSPVEVFPGLDRQTLLRPPSILPPCVPSRDGDVFADLIRVMRGYPLHVRDEGHRADLLRDARYFHLKGVEQKLIPCDISFNCIRNAHEIGIRLEDIRQSGVSFTSSDSTPTETTSKPTTPSSSTAAPNHGVQALRGYVSYARPFTDEASYIMIVEIGAGTESTKLDVNGMRCTFSGQTKVRIASLFQVIANKLNLPVTQPLGLMLAQTGGGLAAQPASPANSGLSGERVKVSIGRDAWVELDGKELSWDERTGEEDESSLPPTKDWKIGMGNTDWMITKGQWRLRIQPNEEEPSKVELVMCAVKVQAHTAERARNAMRGFLG